MCIRDRPCTGRAACAVVGSARAPRQRHDHRPAIGTDRGLCGRGGPPGGGGVGKHGRGGRRRGGGGSAIAALYRDLDGYPQPLRNQTRQALTAYPAEMINQECRCTRRANCPGTCLLYTSDSEHARRYFEKHNSGFWRRLSNWREIDMARKALVIAGRPRSVLDLPCGCLLYTSRCV